jgi:hypothetical protein
MVLFLLSIKAELENVASVALRPDADVCLHVRNPLADHQVREKVVFNLSQTTTLDPQGGDKGSSSSSREPPHHFALKWDKGPHVKASVLTVLDLAEAQTALKKKKKKKGEGTSLLPRPYTADDAGTFAPLLAVECRGLEPYGFVPMGHEFVVTSSGGTKFVDDVDLGEGDWAEYDEENDGR